MKLPKVHYMPGLRVFCETRIIGVKVARNVADITCHVCMYRYLAEQAPWAPEFLAGLRKADTADKRAAGKTLQAGFRPGLTGFDQVNPDPMPPALVLSAGQGVPVGAPAEANRPVERLGRNLGSLLRNQGVAEKAVSEILTQPEALLAAVQEVVDDSGATAEPVNVEKGEVAKAPGDAG